MVVSTLNALLLAKGGCWVDSLPSTAPDDDVETETGGTSSPEKDCSGCCRIVVLGNRMCWWLIRIVNVEIKANAPKTMERNSLIGYGEESSSAKG